jgi:hypothetical protein
LPIFKPKYSVPSEKTHINKSISKNAKIDCLLSQNSNIEVQIINTLHDLKENTKKFIDFPTTSTFNTKYVDASFSYAYSRGIHSAIDIIIKDNATILFTSINISSTHLSIVESTFELADDFRFVIENMPCCEFNETVEKYINEFIIGYFGYTYITKLQLGGIIQQTIIITGTNRLNLEQNGFNTSNETWLKSVAKEIFLIQTKLKQTKILNNTYEKYFTKGNAKILGGKTSIRSLEDWCNSIPSNPIVVKIGISSISDLLTNQYFPVDSYIYQKATLIRSVVDRYLSNSVYCYDRCTDTIHGTCVDSGYFQFGVCKCESGWTEFNCAIPVRMYFFLLAVESLLYMCHIFILAHYIDTFYNSSILPIWNTRAGRNSYSTVIGYGKGQMPSHETVSNIFDRNIYTRYTSFGSSSANVSSIRSGLNTGFYVTNDVKVCIITGFRFTTATDQSKRDPIIITLEGSNADNVSLIFGKSWTLIYNGSSGLDIDPGRGKPGSLQRFNNSQLYRSYRMLVVSKRDSDSGVHYSEFEFYGHSCLPGKKKLSDI